MKTLKLTSFLKLPFIYLAIIPLITYPTVFIWYELFGAKSIGYAHTSSTLEQQSSLIIGALICLVSLIIVILLEEKNKTNSNNNYPIINNALYLVLALVMALFMFHSFYLLSSFTSYLFTFFFYTVIALIFISSKSYRWFYNMCGVGMLILPCLFIFSQTYLKERVLGKLFLNNTSEQYFNAVQTNINNSHFLGASVTQWSEVPASQNEFFLLKLIHQFGFVPFFILVVLILFLWIAIWIKINSSRVSKPFWQKLASILVVFFVVQTVVNILANLTIIKSGMHSNIFPFTTNISLWLVFIVFSFACWKARLFDFSAIVKNTKPSS